jgi:hypothetical protein
VQRTEIVGPASENGCVRIFLGDGPDQDQSQEWIAVQASADTRVGKKIAAVQLEALLKAQAILERETAVLEPIVGARS